MWLNCARKGSVLILTSNAVVLRFSLVVMSPHFEPARITRPERHDGGTGQPDVLGSSVAGRGGSSRPRPPG